MGVIRLNPPPKLKLARLCVLPEYRKKGHAERLVKTVHDWVISDLRKSPLTKTGAGGEADRPRTATVWLHAQLPVIRFYEKYVESIK